MSQNPEGTRAHFFEVMKDFDTGMLVTRTEEGRLRSRPMNIAEIEPGGDIFFATKIDSPKVQELDGDRQVNITFQGKSRFASVSGVARLVRDRAHIQRLWSESWKIWFPEGQDDPSLCLLCVRPVEGEYWDNAGVKGLRYLFEAAKAYVEGTTPPVEKDHNARVLL